MSIAVPGIGYLAWADAIRKPSNRTQGSLHQGDYHIWPIREGVCARLTRPLVSLNKNLKYFTVTAGHERAT